MDIKMLDKATYDAGLNNKELCHIIGMNESTFYRKRNNDGKGFTVQEMENITSALSLPITKAVDIFFTTSLA